MENFKNLILKRESCRKYNDKKVAKEDLLKIVEAGRLAPSACNSQPWSFHIVTNSEQVKALRQACQLAGFNKFTEQVNNFIVIVEERASLVERVGQRLGERDFVSIDIGLTTAHMVLEATDIGLSTCIIGAFNGKKVNDALNFSDKKKVRLILSVGYSDEEVRNKKRKNLEEIVKFYE